MSKQKIILATGNPHKAIEIHDMLDGAYEVLTMADAGIDVEIVEDGATFEENALIKVRAIRPYVKDTGAILMADDSGLCVDALDGAPGIFSARYAGEHVTYADNNRKLLKALADVPPEKRGAQFVCAVALIFPDGEEWTGRGIVEGQIAASLQGNGGFGYDPLFIAKESGRAYAEMREAEKNAISHRARAMALAKGKIAEKLRIR
jgi:XTP/dITP diphosphohydrolase